MTERLIPVQKAVVDGVGSSGSSGTTGSSGSSGESGSSGTSGISVPLFYADFEDGGTDEFNAGNEVSIAGTLDPPNGQGSSSGYLTITSLSASENKFIFTQYDFSFKAGQVVKITGWVKNGTASAAQVHMAIAGASFSIFQVGSQVVTIGTWKLISGFARIPVDSDCIQIYLYWTSEEGSGTILFDTFTVVGTNGSQPIFIEPTAFGGIAVTPLDYITEVSVIRSGENDGVGWGYKISGVDINGNETNASDEVVVSDGATWVHYNGSTNKNTISWTALPGAISYNIYRTTAPLGGSTGLIASSITDITYIDDKSAGVENEGGIYNFTGSVGGLVSGLVPTSKVFVSRTLRLEECKGAFIKVVNPVDLLIPSIPDDVPGYSFILYIQNPVAVTLKAPSGRQLVLNGALIPDGDKIVNTSTAGDMITLVYSEALWHVLGISTWTDGGA